MNETKAKEKINVYYPVLQQQGFNFKVYNLAEPFSLVPNFYYKQIIKEAKRKKFKFVHIIIGKVS